LLPVSTSEDPCRFESNQGAIDLSSVGLFNGTAKYDNRNTEHKTDYSMFTVQFNDIRRIFHYICRL